MGWICPAVVNSDNSAAEKLDRDLSRENESVLGVLGVVVVV